MDCNGCFTGVNECCRDKKTDKSITIEVSHDKEDECLN